jgi:putative endonuclease
LFVFENQDNLIYLLVLPNPKTKLLITMKKEYHFWTYITTNPERTVMYTGFTSNLPQRLKEHFDNRGNEKTFAGRYYCYNLVYYEYTSYALNAISREKEIKNMSREKKLAMISFLNPSWQFLNTEVCGMWPPTFEGRLKQKEKIETADTTDDEWWIGLTPPLSSE